jgi:NAD(P)-dependent dehydrogenase (short-subunit alcohol dehydrogenase family)
MTRFEHRTLLATGAGAGIGEAAARRFAQEGGRVAVLDIDAKRANRVAGELPGSLGIRCDVSNEGSVAAAVAEAAASFGRIDCVLNCAGYRDAGPIEEFSLAQWNRLLGVHLTGAFLVCKATLPHLRATGRGAIVNTASIAGLVARPQLAAYSAAKGAIIAFSRQLARDVGPEVRVNVVVPGTINTVLVADLWKGREPELAERMATNSILPRVGEPEEIAATIAFLLSDDSSYLTGTLIVADGGMTARGGG